MSIEAGKTYRKRGANEKLIALEPLEPFGTRWVFYPLNSHGAAGTVLLPEYDVEPWRDPVRAECHAYLTIFRNGNHVLSDDPPDEELLSAPNPIVGVAMAKLVAVEGVFDGGFSK
jgi:hypothetical protein